MRISRHLQTLAKNTLAAVYPPAALRPFETETDEPDSGVQTVTASMPARNRKDRQNSAFLGFFSD